MLGTVDWLFIIAIIFFISGFILIGIEMIAPGISVPGIAGMACLIIGIFLAADSIEEGVTITIIILVLLGIMLAIILGVLSKSRLKLPIILKEELNKEKGYISSSDLNYLLGKRGVAISDLRPTGTGSFDGIELDVISEGKYILKGTQLVIYKVQGSKLIVKIDENRL
ncbi:NfeD family protein [Anaerocolumna sp.]|uniref:NfeD family protein n=1 Tax=Anaerocolumna sp. TaxID=2041569 RepID=UPI0028A8A9FD|nr:NfeD family protein [Anaerocolumna sp.]